MKLPLAFLALLPLVALHAQTDAPTGVTIQLVPVTTAGGGFTAPVLTAGDAGTIVLTGSGLFHAIPGLTFGGVVIGTSTLNANATLNLYSSQTLAALNIATGVEVTFGDGLPFAPASAVQTSDFIPEPGSAALLAFGACALLGQRRRTA